MKTSQLAMGLALVASATIALSSHARSIRVDPGDWDLSAFTTTSSTQSLGFNFGALGVSTSSATIDVNGGILLSGGESLNLNPFLEPDQGLGGNTIQYQFGVTNGNFSAAGVDAGFRVSWQTLDTSGALLNEFQASIFDMSNGQFAVEFNYNILTLGDDGSQVGWNSSTGASLDIPALLGLNFADYMGAGDDDFSNNCAATPSALACNNFFAGNFGPSAGILPNDPNGFFQVIDTNGGDAQGRYLFFFGDAVQVAEPGTLALIATGLLGGLGLRRRRR